MEAHLPALNSLGLNDLLDYHARIMLRLWGFGSSNDACDHMLLYVEHLLDLKIAQLPPAEFE